MGITIVYFNNYDCACLVTQYLAHVTNDESVVSRSLLLLCSPAAEFPPSVISSENLTTVAHVYSCLVYIAYYLASVVAGYCDVAVAIVTSVTSFLNYTTFTYEIYQGSMFISLSYLPAVLYLKKKEDFSTRSKFRISN